MISLKIIFDGDNAWPEIAGKEIIRIANDGPPIQLAVLDGGMASGHPSVVLRLDLPDGRVVVAQTSARLFCAAGRAIAAKYPDLFDDA